MNFIGFPGGLRLELTSGTLLGADGRQWCPSPTEYLDVTVPVVSRIIRFSGHCPGLTVAAHSVFVAELARGQGHTPATVAAMAAHDLHEAFVGDVPTPVKRWLRGDTECLDGLHQKVEDHKHRVFGVQPQPDILHGLDYRAAELEAHWFGIDFGYTFQPPEPAEQRARDMVLQHIKRHDAEEYFSERLYQYILG